MRISSLKIIVESQLKISKVIYLNPFPLMSLIIKLHKNQNCLAREISLSIADIRVYGGTFEVIAHVYRE